MTDDAKPVRLTDLERGVLADLYEKMKVWVRYPTYKTRRTSQVINRLRRKGFVGADGKPSMTIEEALEKISGKTVRG